MDYFSERTNPFYDKTCNNEIIKMQRLGPEQLRYINILMTTIHELANNNIALCFCG